MASTLKNDWESLKTEFETQLRAALFAIADGAAADIDGPVREAAMRLAQAVQSGRQDLIDETKDQLAILFIKNKLKAKAGFGAVVNNVLGLVVNLLVNGAIAGIGAVRTL